MTPLFRPSLARWAAAPDDTSWTRLWNDSLCDPLAHLHPSAWAPLSAATRLLLARQRGIDRELAVGQAGPLWQLADQRHGQSVAPLAFGLEQAALWQLVMAATRSELLVLARWCGAALFRRQVAVAVDRHTSLRWRRRLGGAVYADVLRGQAAPGRCEAAVPLADLLAGRLLVDIGLALLAHWAAEPRQWASRRIALAQGPHHRGVDHMLGPGAIRPADAAAVQNALLAFVQEHGHVH